MRFQDNKQAAQALYRYTRDVPTLRHLVLRSYRQLASATRDWWLVPGTAWPAYPYGKLLLRRCPDAPSQMFVGLQVEKGLGRQLPGLVHANLMMMPQWYWHTFINEALAGRLAEPLRAVQTLALPIVVGVELYTLQPSTALLLDARLPADRVTFTVHPTDLNFRTDILSTEVLTWLNGTVNLQDLVGRVLALPQATWHWVSVRVGVQVAYGTAGWEAAALWENACAPWLRWVR